MAFDVDKFLAQVRRKELLDENVVRELCEKTKQVLLHEGNLRPLQAPVVLVGDIHGQFYDLLEIFE